MQSERNVLLFCAAACVCSQEYQQWACLEFYLTRPQEQGGCGGDAKRLCRHLLIAIMDQEPRFVFQILGYPTHCNIVAKIADHRNRFVFILIILWFPLRWKIISRLNSICSHTGNLSPLCLRSSLTLGPFFGVLPQWWSQPGSDPKRNVHARHPVQSPGVTVSA